MAVAVALLVLTPLSACGSAPVPRGLEVGDVLGMDGALLVGAPGEGYPVTSSWRVLIKLPRFSLVDPRDAEAVSLRVGLRSLDVFSGCAGGQGVAGLPRTIAANRVIWSIHMAIDEMPVFWDARSTNPGILLVADPNPQPTGALRYRPTDAEAARRALSLEVSVDEYYPDARQWLDRAARGATVDLTVRLELELADQAALVPCAVMVAELSSEGTTVWMSAGRR